MSVPTPARSHRGLASCGIAATLALATAACREPPPPAPPTITYELRWTTEADGRRLSEEGARLEVDGVSRGVLFPYSPLHLELPSERALTANDSSRVALVVPTQCGESRIPLAIATLSPDPHWAGRGAPMIATLRATTLPRRITVYVDHRGRGAGAEVRVGSTLVPPDPSGLSRLTLLLAACGPEEISVGEPAATVPIPPGVEAVLVDPTGARCYARETVDYAAEGIDIRGSDTGTRFDRALVHPIGLIDHVLTPPPETVRGDLFATRTALVERSCRGRR